MARYEREFGGLAWMREAGGSDPNYREGGYGGMRMMGGRGRAPYGEHRLMRWQDMEGSGGTGGIYRRMEGYQRNDPRWEDRGGVSDPHRNQRMIRDFNARSPNLEPHGDRGYGREMGGRELERQVRESRERSWSPTRYFRQDYSNRGVTDAGYSEGWARGPMRGAR